MVEKEKRGRKRKGGSKFVVFQVEIGNVSGVWFLSCYMPWTILAKMNGSGVYILG